MVLRKITIDNSVRYIPKNEQAKETQQNKIKNKKQSEQNQPISGGKANTRKQNINFSAINKKFVNDFTAIGFGILE